jgi:hypothetical protein
MKSINIFSLVIISISIVVSIISLFLNLDVPIGLNSKQRIYLSNLATQIDTLSVEVVANTIALQSASTVQTNLTINVLGITSIQSCEQFNRDYLNPGLMNQSATRYQELLIFNGTINFGPVNQGIVTTGVQLNGVKVLLNYTGLLVNYTTGLTTVGWNYTLYGFVLQENYQFYFLHIPETQRYPIFINGTQVVTLEPLNFMKSNPSGSIGVYDEQTLKIESTPRLNRFRHWMYNGTAMNIFADVPFQTGDVIVSRRRMGILI